MEWKEKNVIRWKFEWKEIEMRWDWYVDEELNCYQATASHGILHPKKALQFYFQFFKFNQIDRQKIYPNFHILGPFKSKIDQSKKSTSLLAEHTLNIIDSTSLITYLLPITSTWFLSTFQFTRSLTPEWKIFFVDFYF